MDSAAVGSSAPPLSLMRQPVKFYQLGIRWAKLTRLTLDSDVKPGALNGKGTGHVARREGTALRNSRIAKGNVQKAWPVFAFEF